MLLAGIGIAQWSVLRSVVPGAVRWIGWTALAWLAGLTVFLLVATPLWQPGQPRWLIAAIGVLAGALMALTMAAATGWGVVRLLAAEPVPVVRPAAGDGERLPEAWTLTPAEVAAGLGVDPATGLDDAAQPRGCAPRGPTRCRSTARCP